MENNSKPTVEHVLGTQVLEILHRENIYDLCIEEDGTLSGNRQTVRGLPTTDKLKNIQIMVVSGKIVITGKITNSTVDVGKII